MSKEELNRQLAQEAPTLDALVTKVSKDESTKPIAADEPIAIHAKRSDESTQDKPPELPPQNK